MKVCHKCRREVPFEGRILRSEECPWCSASLYCCLNCTFHDVTAYNECREPVTERVKERDAANFCNSFTFVDGARAAEGGEEAASKKKLDSLFNF